MDYNSIEKNLIDLKMIYEKELTLKNKIQESKILEEEKVELSLKEMETLDKQILLIKEACIEARKQSKDLFMSLSSHGVKNIFGTNYSVNIVLDEEGSNPSAEFKLVSDYGETIIETDPANEDGGGFADIIALCSFFNLGYLKKNENGTPYFLDEPTKYVSKEYSENVALFIKEISKLLGKQIIMVTHDPASENIADKIFKIELDSNGNTEINS